jgi:hypothetical protein
MAVVYTVNSVLNRIRENSENEFRVIFDQTKSISEKMDIERRIPRIANVQQNHANAHLTDLMDFF